LPPARKPCGNECGSHYTGDVTGNIPQREYPPQQQSADRSIAEGIKRRKVNKPDQLHRDCHTNGNQRPLSQRMMGKQCGNQQIDHGAPQDRAAIFHHSKGQTNGVTKFAQRQPENDHQTSARKMPYTH